MLYRKISKRIKDFFLNEKKMALLITGARQIGKTYVIEEFGKAEYECFLKIDFIENSKAKALFSDTSDAADIILRINTLSDRKLERGKTLIFFDEIQECPEIATQIKYLIAEGGYDYILSGSLLGVELNDIRSQPVGYMDVMDMYPMDLEEFAIANGVQSEVLDSIFGAYEKRTPVDEIVHEKMMNLFKLYMVVGGMPAAVDSFIKTNDINEAVAQQEAIIRLYKKDIAKYDPDDKLYIEEIFELIPSELNSQNKRFILKNLNENFKLSRYENSFIWLKNAGVALPTYVAEEPKAPLLASKSTNLFKLYMADIGLLTSMYMNRIQLKILSGELDINFGALYENIVAQELVAHGFKLYYYNNKKRGEVDFLIELDGRVLPIEVKSGKTYKRHNALNNLVTDDEYDLQGIVLGNGNVEVSENITYLPIYMLMCIRNTPLPEKLIYKPDLSGIV